MGENLAAQTYWFSMKQRGFLKDSAKPIETRFR
jgi:hypothetical protein